MIQVNLLPNIKIEFLRMRRMKRLTYLTSAAISMVCVLAVGALSLYVRGAQNQHIRNIDKDIEEISASIKAIPNLDRVLTVQQQLQSLPDLHNKKPIFSRAFTFLNQLTPTNTGITRLSLNAEAKQMSLSGSAPSLEAVNTYVDTVKYAQYETQGVRARAFSNVTSSIGRGQDRSTFTLTMNYDPKLFDFSATNLKLVINNVVTTRLDFEKQAFDTAR